MYPLKSVVLLFIIVLSCPYKLALADKLIFATEITRHGERTPSLDLPNFPSNDPLGFGQLTPGGINQLITLGKICNNKYIQKYSLLQNNYNPNEVYARATDFDRTLMSANAFLIGMYNSNEKQQPFSIHSKSISEDELLLGYAKYYDIIAKNAQNNLELIGLSEKLQPKFKILSSLFNMEIENIDDFVSIVDVIYIRKQLHQELPAALSEDEINNLHHDASRASALVFQQQEIGALTTANLIEKLYEYASLSISNKNTKRFVLYSAHDVTLLGLLSAIGNPAKANPSPSSNISFLLFDNEQGQYYTKFLFNNMELQIPGCDNKTFCNFDEFERLTEDIKLLAQKAKSLNLLPS